MVFRREARAPRVRRHGAGAFTLVELLVVIGIIALLIGILLPSLSRAQRSAKSVLCLANLKQLSAAAMGYAASNRGMFQMSTYTIVLPNGDWESRFLQYSIRTNGSVLNDFSIRDGILSPYLDAKTVTNLKVFECPEAIDLPHTTLPGAVLSKYPFGSPEYDLLTNISYGSNMYLGQWSAHPQSMTNRVSRIKNASETVMFADAAVMGLASPTSVSRYNSISSPSGAQYAPGGGLFHGRHANGKGGVAWVDGHATLETPNTVDRPPSSPTVAAARTARRLGYIEPNPNFVGDGSDPSASYYYLPIKGVDKK